MSYAIVTAEESLRQRTALGQPIGLDIFEGPLDLLLTLVLREEVELLELPVADLVDAALAPDSPSRFGLDAASELALLMAALADLKSRRMLGEPHDEEPDADALEAAERLAARVVAYAPFRRCADWLAERGRTSEGARYRRVPLGDPPPSARERPEALREAMERLVTAPPAPSLAHLTQRRVDLPALLRRVRDLLRPRRRVSFEGIVGDGDRLEEGMTLLACLELARRGEARLEQERPFEDITIHEDGR